MKNNFQTDTMPHFLFPIGMALILGLALPFGSQAATTTLATAPLVNSTTSPVLPNLMFVLDDSGSMDWDYLPDAAKNFAGNYGFNSSHCNGVYYNPDTPYKPPVDANKLSYDNTNSSSYLNNTFTHAYVDGFNPGAGYVDLDTDFTGGSGSGASGFSTYSGPAYYYTYGGTQITAAQMNFNNTGSQFYTECNSGVGGGPGNSIFKLTTLSSNETSTLTISSNVGTITVGGSGSTRVNGILVNGTVQLMSNRTSSSSNTNTLAGYIASAINASGYSASSTNNVVTVNGPNAGGGLTVSDNGGGMTFLTAAQNGTVSTMVNSIMVGSTNIMSSGSTGSTTSPSTLASSIAGKIASPYTATAAGNVVTITGPNSGASSPVGLTPVISLSPTSSGSLTAVATIFPDADPAHLQNFANWYTYYSHRMLMMKTGVGLAFSPLDQSYRIGYMTMNNNNWNGTINSSTADFVDLAPFDATQKATWYDKLYKANPGSTTPLRGALSNVGRLYAAKFAPTTTYTATITVSGSGPTTVDSITVNGVALFPSGTTATSSYTSRGKTYNSTQTLASNIASAINAPASSDFGATVSGSTVTITGPASSSTPNITQSGSMYVTPSSFVATTTQANLNGVLPKDPMQYSCQQNFVILSTDGYWNGKNTYDLSNPPVNVGEQDGSDVARPKYDGANGVTTLTTNYSRTYQTASYTNCPAGQAEITTQPQTETCTTTISLGTAQPESCPASWTNGTPTTAACAVAAIQNPNPSNPQVVSQTKSSSSSGGTSNTLADVAMYYYDNDLRTTALNNCSGALGGDVCTNNVPKTADDQNVAQHMSTFTLGLGASGKMQYSGTYAKDTSGDYYSVAHQTTASSSVCTWQTSGTTCNWPQPVSGQSTTIDDLWHAAVDGGGTYFSASDPTTLALGLNTALSSISSRRGSGSAGAPSKLNPTPGTDYDYKPSYTTVLWQGNLEARPINANQVVSSAATWCAENTLVDVCPSPGIEVQTSGGTTPTYSCVTANSTQSTCASPGVFDPVSNQCSFNMAVSCIGTMPSMVASSSDTRNIYTANSNGTALTPFLYANLTSGQQADFTSPYINGLSQWGTLTPAQQTAAQGANLVNYLRGQYAFDTRTANYLPPTVDNRLFRYRLSTMGDVLESHPFYVAAPVFTYTDPGYSTFASTEASRTPMVYVGANDGMLHAFYAKDQISYTAPAHCVVGAGQYCGLQEAWAYVPSIVIPKMWKLADTNYGSLHTNFVNGSPVVSDVCTANCDGISGTPVWKSILVGGLNQGGRGYYALDVTNPTAPKLLWEFTAAQDSDMGYSYGIPVITARADGKWVVLVTSGYDNGTSSATQDSSGVTTTVPNSPAGSGQGYLYVLDAGTGAVLSKIGTGVGTASNPSGLAKIAAWNDAPSSNRVTWVYGGDLQGNLWRFNINDPATAAIGTGSVFDLAVLEDPTGNAQPITQTPILGKISNSRVIFVGTGQYLGRPDLLTNQVQTEYAIKDNNATTTLVNPRTTLVQQTLVDNGNGSRSSSSSNTVDFTTGLGWYVDFPDSGERVNVDGILSQGTLTVPSNVPSNTACTPGGYGWNNSFNYLTGTAANPDGVVSTYYSDMIVGVTILYSNGQGTVEVSTAGGDTIIDPNKPPPGNPSQFTGQRVLWRELNP
jgi:type IV pilus assembly protein PilY1